MDELRDFAFSDLHLTDDIEMKERIDMFEYALFGTYIPNNLLLLGDIFDIYRDSLDNIVRRCARFFEIISKVKGLIYYVPGNHDDKLAHLYVNSDKLKINHMFTGKFLWENGPQCVLIHGHRYDKIVREHYRASKIGTRFQEWIWRLSNGKVDIAPLWSFAEAVMDDKRLLENVRNSVLKEFCSENRKVIFMGHTHKPELIRKDGSLIVDCGDFCSKFSWVEIKREPDGIFNRFIDLCKLSNGYKITINRITY